MASINFNIEFDENRNCYQLNAILDLRLYHSISRESVEDDQGVIEQLKRRVTDQFSDHFYRSPCVKISELFHKLRDTYMGMDDKVECYRILNETLQSMEFSDAIQQ